MHWVYLLMAICAEVFATTFLKFSEGFTRLWPSFAVIVGYSVSFYLLSQTLRVLPIGIAYAMWSGVGIVLITFLGWVVHHQKLDMPALIGIAFIGVGVIILNLFSKGAAMA